MSKKNCWEVKKCGREPSGAKVKEFGVCPAAEQHRADGINGGVNGGRSCWAVAGTFCGGAVQGAFASKLDNCIRGWWFSGAGPGHPPGSSSPWARA